MTSFKAELVTTIIRVMHLSSPTLIHFTLDGCT